MITSNLGTCLKTLALKPKHSILLGETSIRVYARIARDLTME